MLSAVSRTQLVWPEAQGDLRFPPWPSPWCRWAAETAAPGWRGRSAPWPRRVFRWCWGWGRRTVSCDCRLLWALVRLLLQGRASEPPRLVWIAVIAELIVGEIHLRVFVRRPEVEDADLTPPAGLVRRECGPAESVFARNMRIKSLECSVHLEMKISLCLTHPQSILAVYDFFFQTNAIRVILIMILNKG